MPCQNIKPGQRPTKEQEEHIKSKKPVPVARVKESKIPIVALVLTLIAIVTGLFVLIEEWFFPFLLGSILIIFAGSVLKHILWEDK